MGLVRWGWSGPGTRACKQITTALISVNIYIPSDSRIGSNLMIRWSSLTYTSYSARYSVVNRLLFLQWIQLLSHQDWKVRERVLVRLRKRGGLMVKTWFHLNLSLERKLFCFRYIDTFQKKFMLIYWNVYVNKIIWNSN